MTDNTVAIMMATYNGEQYIEEQIQSLQKQTYSDWVLFVRDDGSTDATAVILEEKSRQDNRIHVLSSIPGGGSAKENFALIHTYVKENYDFSYFMFCDQDDVWLPDKIEVSMKRMKRVQKDSLPVLIHTDLKVVDEHLNVLGDSFIKYRALNPRIQDINHLLAQNNVTGCTMLWNKELNNRIDLKVDGIAMHDWWIAILASLYGRIEYLFKPTILYRQHGDNTVGATKVNHWKFICDRMKKVGFVGKTISDSVRQAQMLADIYGNEMDKNQRDIIIQYGNLLNKNRFLAVGTIIKNHFLKQGIVQKCGQILYWILFRRYIKR